MVFSKVGASVFSVIFIIASFCNLIPSILAGKKCAVFILVKSGVPYSKVLFTSIQAGLIKLDETVEGTYWRVLSTSISSGRIVLAEVNGDLDDIDDGSTYRRTTANEKTGADRAPVFSLAVVLL